MKETSAARRRYKARKIPTIQYPIRPPEIAESIEVLYLSADKSILDSACSHFRDQIVTSHIHYKPAILAMARLTFQGRWNIHNERDIIRVVSFPAASRQAEWDKSLLGKWDSRDTQSSPDEISFFIFDPACDFSSGRFELLQEEFIHSMITQEVLTLNFNPYLKIYRRIDEPEEEFFERCMEQIRESFSQEMNTLQDTIQRQQYRLKERLNREVREVREMENGQEEASNPEIAEIKKELQTLEETRETRVKEFENSLHALSRDQEIDIMRLSRNNAEVLRFAFVWLPYTEFVIQERDRRRVELIQSF